MVGEVDRLNRTVSALLQFARPRELELASIDLGEILLRTFRLMQDDLKAQSLKFEIDTPSQSCNFNADSDLITQVLINLLQNAEVATESGGIIRLGAEERDANIHLWVEDTGKGMTEEEQSLMFDPFFTTKKTGTGLGLAVVQQIVEQHGGHIEVMSKPGQGTHIEVILPSEQIQRENSIPQSFSEE